MLAERLWQEKNYAAAVTEYEKVVQKDPSSDLGIEAAYRAATASVIADRVKAGEFPQSLVDRINAVK